MALARVGFVEGTQYFAETSVVTINGVTAGNSLLILLIHDGVTDPTVSSITCSGETIVSIGTDKLDYASAIGANVATRWYAINSVASSGNKEITCVLTASAQTANRLHVWEISGADTGGIFDANLSANGTSSVPSGNITTTVSPTAIFAFATGTSSKPTAGGAYTAETAGNTIWYSNIEYDIDAGSAGSKTVDFGVSQTNWGLHAISIKESGSGSTKPAFYYSQL